MKPSRIGVVVCAMLMGLLSSGCGPSYAQIEDARTAAYKLPFLDMLAGVDRAIDVRNLRLVTREAERGRFVVQVSRDRTEENHGSRIRELRRIPDGSLAMNTGANCAQAAASNHIVAQIKERPGGYGVVVDRASSDNALCESEWLRSQRNLLTLEIHRQLDASASASR